MSVEPDYLRSDFLRFDLRGVTYLLPRLGDRQVLSLNV